MEVRTVFLAVQHKLVGLVVLVTAVATVEQDQPPLLPMVQQEALEAMLALEETEETLIVALPTYQRLTQGALVAEETLIHTLKGAAAGA
tara:strand:- start:421 stop:687 length:267 start_codon:yes stop_codon:yes gene_type:complete